MALSAGGIGSGLDVAGIVSQLMTLERRPLDLLQTQETTLSAQLSAYGQLKSSLSGFQDAMDGLSSLDKFKVFSATPSDDNEFTATTNSSAAAGTYTINVTRLAESHKMTTDGAGYSAETGSLEISVGATAFTVTIDGTNNSLSGIRNAINSATDNAGVTATIINDGTSDHLVLTSDDSGNADALTITSGTVADALALTTIAGQNTSLLDAALTIDGIAVTSASNSVTAIDGITLNLKGESGVDDTLTVSRDTSAVKESVQTFIDMYNGLRSTISTLHAEGATLEGDSGLLSIERMIRNEINTAASGLNYGYLSDLGITTNASTGDLELDTTDLDTELTNDFSGVADFFANNGEGIAYRLDALATSLLATDGLIDSREDGINSSIDYNQDRQLNVEYRLELTEQRYIAQFSALDQLVAQLTSTGNFLTAQLDSLPGFTR
jgi:flagellar hook-associated protein 2